MKQIRITSVISRLFASLLFFSSCKSPSPSILTDSDKQYIRDSNASAQDGWNQGQREPFINRYSSDAIIMPPNTESVVGKDSIRAFVNLYPDMKIYLNDVEIIGSSDNAYVRGTYKLTTPADAFLDKGKYVSYWKKLPDGKWMLTHDIFNSDVPILIAQGSADQKK